MDSHKGPRAPGQHVRPRLRDEWISENGWELLWIDAILLIPAIFGLMFLFT